MSIRIMTHVWGMNLPNAGEKIVLLALADSANDEGMCYPSVEKLATKCSMSVRAVRNHLRSLELVGALVRWEREGRSSVYMLTVSSAGETSAPVDDETPADSAPQPRQILHTPPADSAYTPADSAPITITQPPRNLKRAVPPPHACAHEEAPAVRAEETRETRGGQEGEEPTGPPAEHARLAARLRADRIPATPAIVETWLAEGANAAQILHAAAIARTRKPPPQRIPATYLTPIIADLKANPNPGRGDAERSRPRRLSAAEQATADAERFERAHAGRESERDISARAQRIG